MSRWMGANERAAHQYADAGWHVFPLIPRGKTPATEHGLLEATTDHRQIEQWWRAGQERNVAIRTGAPFGPDVLDVNRSLSTGDNGFPALRDLKRAGLVPQHGALIRTPRGGAHLTYEGTEQRNGSIPKAHIDYRAAGGYVVAAPSVVRRDDGQVRGYQVVDHGHQAGRLDWAAVREHLAPQPQRQQWHPPLRLANGGRQNLDHLVTRMADQQEGNRGNFLYWAANRALDHDQPHRLEDLAQAAVAAGLHRREVDRTIDSARATPRQDPHVALPSRSPAQLTAPAWPGDKAAGHSNGGRDERRPCRSGPAGDADRDAAAPGDDGSHPASRDQPTMPSAAGLNDERERQSVAATQDQGQHRDDADATAEPSGEADGRPFELEPSNTPTLIAGPEPADEREAGE